MAQSQCSGCPSASSCSAEQRENCDSAQQSMLEPANKYSKVKKVIGIVSGKGGVGKSFVTASLASAMKKAALWMRILQGRLFQRCLALQEKLTATLKA